MLKVFFSLHQIHLLLGSEHLASEHMDMMHGSRVVKQKLEGHRQVFLHSYSGKPPWNGAVHSSRLGGALRFFLSEGRRQLLESHSVGILAQALLILPSTVSLQQLCVVDSTTVLFWRWEKWGLGSWRNLSKRTKLNIKTRFHASPCLESSLWILLQDQESIGILELRRLCCNKGTHLNVWRCKDHRLSLKPKTTGEKSAKLVVSCHEDEN